jgi:hypothetical protein
MKESLKKLSDLAWDDSRLKYPNLPDHARVRKKYDDRTANGLTKCIIDFLKFTGNQGERVSNTGRYIDSRETVTNILGQKKVIGTGKWIPGSGTKGTADIHATIEVNVRGHLVGVSVKWEVKIGRDRQSIDQKIYESQVKESRGWYFTVTDFDQFLIQYEYVKRFYI